MKELNLDRATFLENKIADIEYIQNELREFINAEKDSYLNNAIMNESIVKLSSAIDSLINANAEISKFMSSLYIDNAFR